MAISRTVTLDPQTANENMGPKFQKVNRTVKTHSSRKIVPLSTFVIYLMNSSLQN